jgi:hypothetical protein
MAKIPALLRTQDIKLRFLAVELVAVYLRLLQECA